MYRTCVTVTVHAACRCFYVQFIYSRESAKTILLASSRVGQANAGEEGEGVGSRFNTSNVFNMASECISR